jgi:hypothetical protein
MHGGGDRTTGLGVGCQLERCQFIQRRLNPVQAKHHSFSRWASTSAVV